LQKNRQLSKVIIMIVASFFASMLFTGLQPQIANAEATTGYQVTATQLLGGTSGWDYLTFDNNTRQLFIARRELGVNVVNVDTHQLIGAVKDTRGVNGIALVPEFNRGYATLGEDDLVAVFNLTTLAPIEEIIVGKDPDCITYDPATKRVFTINGEGGSTTVIDAATGKVVGTILLSSKKTEFAVADGKGKLFVNLQDKNEVITIDTNSLKIINQWSIGSGKKPTPMAIDVEKDRLFVGCRNSVMVILDAKTGSIMAELPVGAGIDAVVFDPVTQLVFGSNGDGTMTVIQETAPGKYTVIDTIKTLPGARTIALDPKNHSIYAVTAQFGTPEKPGAKPPILPDTFVLLTISR